MFPVLFVLYELIIKLHGQKHVWNRRKT